VRLANRGWSPRRSGPVVALLTSGLLAAAWVSPAAASPSTTSSSPAASASPTKTQNATYGIGPATAKGLDGRPYLNYTTSAGARTTDHVGVRNYGSHPIRLRIYAADATASASGAIGFAPETKPGTDASRWITFPAGGRTVSVLLAPGQLRILPIEIAVPADASPGDHLAGVMAAFTGRVIGKSGQAINLEQRVALRALFRVSGEIHSQLSVQGLAVDYHGTLNPFGAGSATVTYSVRNTGNVLISGTQRVGVTGIFGSTGATSKLVRLPLMLPGATFPMRVEVQHVWPQLVMHARVTVKPLGVAGAVDPRLTPADAATSFWAVPWTLLGLIVAAGALIALALVWRKRLNARPAAHSARKRTATTPALGET
jgi:hypothetical protein